MAGLLVPDVSENGRKEVFFVFDITQFVGFRVLEAGRLVPMMNTSPDVRYRRIEKLCSRQTKQ